jgi:ankyrin repeat protein
MPLELPSDASLEFLRKQAKALLRDFRERKPQALEKFDTLSLKSAPKLSDAQHLIAREYGFTNWAALKERIDSFAVQDPVELVKKAFHQDDAAEVRRLLSLHPQLKSKAKEPIGGFDSPPITQVRSRAMLDVLLDAGADINAKSQWWAGGFGLLDNASPELAAYAIERGAVVTVHSAARLGMLEKLQQLVSANPELVKARGGDGQTPLHFASTMEIAAYLLDHGAEIDARDVDHESTPAQYMLGERAEIARYLIGRGAKSDILMAAALGDITLVRRHLDADPESIRMRISDEYFPKINPHSGGTIYQWKLGWHVSAPQIARKFGHQEVLDLLMQRSPADERLLNYCWLGDEAGVRSLLKSNSNLASTLSEAGRRQLAHAARNNDTTAVRLMLLANLPVNAFSQHRAQPLHWAGFHGNVEMTKLLLARNAEINNHDNEYDGTPLGWAIYGSERGWYSGSGDYAATVTTLLEAGAKLPEKLSGTKPVRQILRRHGVK